MKLFLAILILNLNVSAAVYSQRINLNVTNQPFREVMTSIREQSGYYFFFPTQMLKKAKPVTVNLKQASIEETLQKICEGQPFTYTIKDQAILLKLKAGEGEPSSATINKKTDIRGTITDAEGRPLAGATVVLAGQTNMGTSTNDQGEFILTNVPESGKLIVRMIGYGTKEVIYATNSIPRILLNQIDTDMDEIQVIGYGKVSKRLNTGNVGSINSAAIEKQNINNPILALQGRIPGVEITQVKGVNGSRVKINIRGVNTLTQGTDPLFIIDGVPFASNMYSLPGFTGLNSLSGGGGLNPLSLINPTDIESIDVLKDADATAIYGSRGSNGVVLITTKKGKAGPVKVDLNFQTGFGNVSRKANFLNTQQYIDMRKEAFANGNITPTISNARDLLVYDQNAYTDWQEIMIGETSNYTNFNTSISGGNATTQYLIGGNYHHETTVFPGNLADRKLALHINLNSSSINQKFTVNFSGNYLDDSNELPNVDFTQYISLAPNAPNLYSSDGNLDWTNYTNNPFRDLLIKYIGKSKNLIANAIASYTIFPGLEISSSIGYNNILLNEKRLSPIGAFNPSNGILTGSSSFNKNDINSWIIEPQINYQRRIAKGRLSILFGGTIQHRRIEGQLLNAFGYTDDGLLGTLAGAKEVFKGETIYEEYKYSSLLGRLNYNWENKYLLNVTARRDGSSRFGPGRQFGNFGAIGVGWIFTREDFVQSILPFVSYGKLRGSYGTSGNEPSTNYAFYELYNINPALPYGGGTGILPNNIPTADYRWEVNKKAEVGLEFGLFNDRIISTTSFYRNRSTNQLVTRPLASSVGFGSIIANFPAVVQNKGWEVTLATENIKRKKFSWQSTFNLTIARNKLLKYDGNEFFGNFKVGESLNTVAVYKSAGVDAETGFYRFYNHNGDITETPQNDDRVIRVNLDQKFFGGIQNTFNYGGFSLDVNFHFVKQNGLNYLFANSQPPGFFQRSTGLGNQPVAVLDRAQIGKSESIYQKFSTTIQGFNSYNFAKGSDLIYTDASFIRLKNASLSYLMPLGITKKLHLQNLRVYLQGQNLFTITKYKGADPEVQNISSLPTLRIITAGIQVTL